MWNCFKCGEDKVFWNSDFDADECGYEHPGIVSYYTCANCGSEYEVFEPFPEEEEEDE